MDSTRRTLFILTLAIAGAGLVACGNNDNDAAAPGDVATPTDTTAGTDAMPPYDDDGADTMDNDTSADAAFYQQAMQGNQKEIVAGELAQQQAQDEAVRNYATMMVQDHTAMGQELSSAAGMADAATPAPPPTALASLQDASGEAFDDAYMDMMVADHEKTIALFEDAAQNASATQTRTLAANALPKLREHLEQARELQQR